MHENTARVSIATFLVCRKGYDKDGYIYTVVNVLEGSESAAVGTAGEGSVEFHERIVHPSGSKKLGE